MYEIPISIKKAADKYEPITVGDHTLFPISVKQYDLFVSCEKALGFMAQTLPVRYLSTPLLKAFYEIDMEALAKQETVTGLFFSTLLALSLALRLAPDGELKDVMEKWSVSVDKDTGDFKSVCYVDPNSGKTKQITATQYQKLRYIIAAQNGVEIPSENVNPELVQAEIDLAQNNAPKLEININDQISALCLLTNKEERDIDDWPILKFERRCQSLQRMLDYVICGVGETQGTKWKGGNPHPHPYYRKKKNSSAMAPLENFAGGNGVRAINNAGGTPANV